MRIGIHGAGGVGGYFGARLAAAGNDVAFIARGAHGQAMARDGLRVSSSAGDLHVKPVAVAEDPRDLAPLDLVLLCVKLYDLEPAVQALRPALAPDALVIPCQNGIDSEEQVAAQLGADRVAAGIAYISASVAEPGLIAHHGRNATLTVGPLHPGQMERLQALKAAGNAAGFNLVVREDMRRALWEKFVLLAPFAAVTALTRQTAGAIAADPDLLALFRAAVDEAAAVGRAAGIDLDAEITDRCVAAVTGMPPEMQASMALDLSQGRRLELDGLSGALVRLGREHGEPVPVHSVAYAALKPFRDGAPRPA